MPLEDLSGRRLGDYLLLRRLGAGAMAEVYLAEQQSLKRQVAIKILKPHLASDQTYLARFRLEAESAARLVHGNIVQIHHVGCVEGLHFIAQEYVAGKNLRQLIAAGPIDAALVASVVRQAAGALQLASEHGVVHRDIKPDNILLTSRGEVKVADFGLARQTESAELGLTQAGMTMGTPLYMSPEQVEGRPLDTRSDLYSLGVTAFHMLTRQPPFTGDTALAVAVQHLKREPPRLETLRPDTPPALCRIVHKLMAKRAEDRFATPKELMSALRAVPAGEHDAYSPAETLGMSALTAGDATQPAWNIEISAATQQLAKLMKHPQPKWWDRRPWLAAVVVAAAAFILGAGVYWATRPTLLLGDLASPAVNVPQRPTIREQMNTAYQLDNEAAWRAVVQYYSDKEPFVHMARRELARIYFHEQRYVEADEVCRQLVAVGGQDNIEFKAYGLAGQYVLLVRAGKREEATQLLAATLEPILDHLRNDQMPDKAMMQLVAAARKANHDPEPKPAPERGGA